MPERNAITEQKFPVPVMPLVACKPWCDFQDGHPNNTCREDQWCASTDVHLPLFHPQAERAEMEWNFLSTYVLQSPGEAPRVHIGIGERGGFSLKLDESVDLAMILLRQAERVRRDQDACESMIGMPVGERPGPPDESTAS